VQDSRERQLGREREALARKVGGELFLRGESGGRPRAHLRLGRVAAGSRNALGERRRLQDHDRALPERRLGALAADETAPARGGDGVCVRGRACAAAGDGEEGCEGRRGGEEARRARRTRRAQGTEDTEGG